jgi:hypothetical protein
MATFAFQPFLLRVVFTNLNETFFFGIVRNISPGLFSFPKPASAALSADSRLPNPPEGIAFCSPRKPRKRKRKARGKHALHSSALHACLKNLKLLFDFKS